MAEKGIHMNFKILRTLLILALLQSGGWGQEDSLQFPKIRVAEALEHYSRSLQHPNDGVVASAIFKVVKLKMWYPGEDFTRVRAQLETLMAERSTPSIRLKAFVANSYLSHPEWFNWIGEMEQEDTEIFFQMLSERLDRQLQNIGFSRK